MGDGTAAEEQALYDKYYDDSRRRFRRQAKVRPAHLEVTHVFNFPYKALQMQKCP